MLRAGWSKGYQLTFLSRQIISSTSIRRNGDGVGRADFIFYEAIKNEHKLGRRKQPPLTGTEENRIIIGEWMDMVMIGNDLKWIGILKIEHFWKIVSFFFFF